MNIARLRALYERVQGLDVVARASLLDAEAIDADVRAELEALLDAGEAGGDPIAAAVGRAAIGAAACILPDRIGPWRVLRPLGEGGMGTVLLAERADGEFEMKVAIKLIRGLATADTRERFRRERQALAGLDHPNIAALLDGGATEAGEPYLVMAYVEGETLTEWRARVQPKIEMRLVLFAALCRAVAHAHQHLLVHRDIKPANILVRADGVPVLLDFGIAKLIEPDGDGDATATRLMTPAWASPEQLLGRPVTTATDVYGLGLVLYELLAGGVPRRGDVAEAASIELPPPSKLAAEARSPAVRDEARRIRGDLDKIVRRAVRTEPSARYASALALAADVEAWLAGKPVTASGTHAAYLFSRFVRRHRVATIAVSAALAASAAFALGLVQERDRARAAEMHAMAEAAVSNETTHFLVDLFSEIDPQLHPGHNLSARELLDLGSTSVADLSDRSRSVRARLQQSLGGIYSNIGEPARAIELLEAARTTSATDADAVRADIALSTSYNQLKRFQDAYDAAQRAVSRAQAVGVSLADALVARGTAEQSLVRFDAAEASFAQAQALYAASGDVKGLASVPQYRAGLAERRGDTVAALGLYEEACARKRAAFGNDHPKTLDALFGRAKLLAALGRHQQAIVAFKDLLDRNIRVRGERSEAVQRTLSDLGSVLQDAGRFAEAQPYYERALATARALDDGTGAVEAIIVNNLASLLEDRGDYAGAEAGYRRSLQLRERALPEGHPARAVPAHNLARVLLADGRAREARPFAERALALRAAALPAGHPRILETQVLLAQIELAGNELAAAQKRFAPFATDADPKTSPLLRAQIDETRALFAKRGGRKDERIAALRRALAARAEVVPATHPRLALHRLDLVDALLDAGDGSAARSELAQIAPILRAQFVAQAPALGRLAALEARAARSAVRAG
jgi:serine/threonine-protein kinase